jgi:starch-binding outer membrane protein, SusD/RagB family
MRNGYPIGHASSGYNETTPYTNRDVRLANNILHNGMTMRSTVINTGADSPTSDGLNITTASTRTGYYMLKLLRVTVNMNPASTTTARHFYTHIRWTEIFLNFAEASNEAWGPDDNRYGLSAREVIARIRLRATITQPDAYLAEITTQEQMRALIRNERRLELCFEGHRFWDLRRWRTDLTEPAKGVSITGGTNYSYLNVEPRIYTAPAGFYGPIPQAEILKNENLIQNNGW